jgi:hypothetical protein
MFRTVRAAVRTACRAASLQDWGLVPTISRMMITPMLHLIASVHARNGRGHHVTKPAPSQGRLL